MHVFKDTEGRSWMLSINVTSIRRVRGLVGVDLCKLIDDKLQPFADLVSDPCKLVDVLYCLCKDEADKRGVSDEDFGRAMAGDVIDESINAFTEELIDFFQNARIRASLRTVIAKGKTIQAKMLEHAEVMLAKIDPEGESRTLISSLTNSPASSELTQAR